MATKIDKKELEEPDKLQLFFLGIRAFVEKYRTRIYAGAGILMLIILMGAGWYFYQLNYETTAGKLYNRVFDAAMKADPSSGDATVIQGYKDLIAKYPRSDAATKANYRLGNLYFTKKEYDASISAYQEFLKKASPQSDLITLVYSGLGSCYEAKKDFGKALEFYEKTLKTGAAPSFDVLNFSNMGRIYEEMNDPGKAAEFYRKALGKTSDPLMTLYLKRKISILG
jgi:tetratricopeptide (TPR) repeat protein